MKTEVYINKIIEETGLSNKEIEKRVKEKKEELKGLISEEGALFIIAKELGVDVKEENKNLLKDIDINISDITPNMKNITLIGRIKEVNEIRSFTKKEGGTGNVGSFLLHDNTGDVQIVLWDDLTQLLKDQNFIKNELVKILNGYAKNDRSGAVEIHIGRLGRIILAPEDVDYKLFPKIKEEFFKIKDISLNQKSISLEGKVIQKIPIKEFTRKSGEKGQVCSIILMDSTRTIRITFWNEDTSKVDVIDTNDMISISSLNPKLSTLDEITIDLFANRSTIIKKIKKDIKLNIDLVDNIKLLQDKQNLVSFQGVISSIDNIRTITSKSGESFSLLGFTISDETDGIRVTAWREKAEELSEILTVGKGVTLNNVMVKFSNFSSRNEISLIRDSSIELIDLKIENIKIGDEKEIELIDKIEKVQNKTGLISIQGIISSIDNIKTITSKSGESFLLLGFTINDDTDGIRVTAWREKAEELSEMLTVGKGVTLNNVMAKFSNFSNRNEISLIRDSSIELIDLKIDDIKPIQESRKSQDNNIIAKVTNIDMIKTSGLFEIKGVIVKEINKIFIYEACSNCNKKTENCSCEQKENTIYRMILNLTIDDESGTMRTTFFGEVAERIIGESAEKIQQIKETPDYDRFLEKKSLELTGKDVTIRGRAKFSEYTSSYELMADNFQEISTNEELEKIIQELEL